MLSREEAKKEGESATNKNELQKRREKILVIKGEIRYNELIKTNSPRRTLCDQIIIDFSSFY